MDLFFGQEIEDLSSYGKKLEQEVRQALKALGAWTVGQREIPPLDYLAVMEGGAVWGVECKECRSDRFPWARLSPRERLGMSGLHARGGKALLVIQRVFPGSSRTWACTWPDVARLLVQSPASISLKDSLRPECLVELKKVQRDNGLGNVWDMFGL